MTQDKKIKTIKTHLDKTLSYAEYRDLVERLLSEGKSTGHTQNEAYLNYSKLGFSRMKRWEKLVKLTDEQVQIIQDINQPQTWLVIAEGWCGDAAPALPVMKKIADVNPLIDFRIILRDDHQELMNEFLTNGGQSIPKLIAFDPKEDQILFTWGPRPQEAADMVAKEKEEFGYFREEFKIELQRWYNQDKGKSIASDLVDCLKQELV
jgi:hypothetical protein